VSSPTSRFVEERLAEYYREHSSEIQAPPLMERREFGFLLFRERIMLRHKAFRDMGTLTDFLRRATPSHVYYSGAYYERPEAEMDEKGWLGADLVFDIDADHIPTPCNKAHDTWVCGNCGRTGTGAAPSRCPACGEGKFDERTWPCEVCLASAKAEAVKLLDFLTGDFGLSTSEIRVFFSGNRGYHVHVESEEVRYLDQQARSEVVDYLLGIGLEPGLHGLGPQGGPDLSDSGWRGRIARGTYGLLLSLSPEGLEGLGLRKGAVKALISRRDALLGSWKGRGPWGAVPGVGEESWGKVALRGAEGQSARIDTVVTTDVHRLVRLAGTLHGKTGLKKAEVPLPGVEGFDPFGSAVAFRGGATRIVVSEAPQFRLGDAVYGPYQNQEVELPTAAALLLLCKGRAQVKGEG